MRKVINNIYQKAKKPLGRLWKWAKGPHNLKRFKVLTGWAKHRAQEANTQATKNKWKQIEKQYQKKYDFLKSHKDPHSSPNSKLLVNFDGHQVPSWIVDKALKPARKSGVWKGQVFSGFRSPEYSTQLCENICGAPTCPGRCAGATSNHSCPPTHSGEEYEGAVDVTDSAGLQQWCRAHGNPIRGNGELLPSDTPHFSRNGN